MPSVPPENTGYMLLGYAVVAIILAALVVYLVMKTRNLRSELSRLEAQEREDQASSQSPAAPDNRSQQDVVS
jgi:heme exporter protein D